MFNFRTVRREEVGAANVPAAHTRQAAEAGYVGYDETRDEYPAADTPAVRTPAERMRWRPVPTVAPPAGPATETAGPADHAHGGRPDPRRAWGSSTVAGYPGPKQEGLRPGGTDYTRNERYPEPVDVSSPLTQNKGGHTSADVVRPAMHITPLYVHPFDQWSEQNFGRLDKIEQANPQAGTPYNTDAPVGSRRPSPGGGFALSRLGPALGIQPNTYRAEPRPWDERLINTGPDTINTESARRANGWRLHG